MSFVGQVDCHRMVIGPVCPFEIIGNARAVAPAAPARNFRRVGFAVLPALVASVMASSVVIGLWGSARCDSPILALPRVTSGHTGKPGMRAGSAAVQAAAAASQITRLRRWRFTEATPVMA